MDLGPDVNSDRRRALPSIDKLSSDLRASRPDLPRWAATEGARRTVESARARLGQQDQPRDTGSSLPDPEGHGPDWVRLAAAEADELAAPHPRRVINATGVVLHTNLGRAPMAPGAAQAAASAAAGYSDLELDVASGSRGNRLGALETRLRLLSGAEAAYACNNNAAALLLILNTLASGREVIVSRGELVEIGGSFRVPEIMKRAGVRLVEVGSTNRTHPRDYEDAIGPDTALLLKVHRSNFEVRGFVKEVDLQELARIGREHQVPVVEDLGSGTLVDLRGRGFPAESFAPARLRCGADLICFSGDKLMGGPQAGIVLGSALAMSAISSNPLARALRLDKMTLAALHWTLGVMLEGQAQEELPVLKQLLLSVGALESRTRAFAKRVESLLADTGITAEVGPDRVPLGGGSLPGFELDSCVISLRVTGGAQSFSARLRAARVPVLSRVRDQAVILDLRTVDENEEECVLRAMEAAVH